MKYTDLIRAVLDGKNIQWRSYAPEWKTFSTPADAVIALASDYEHFQYREEPPPPPSDVVRYRHLYDPDTPACDFHKDIDFMRRPYEKVTWDGATGEVKSIELIK